MCGIVGYIGRKTKAVDVVLSGLQNLEYRGYDSAGIAYGTTDRMVLTKQVGRVDTLSEEFECPLPTASRAIGHTRWATHGSPTQANAHPHCNADQSIAVIHNGIIENYAELKARLQKQGYTFMSETDTEVIPHLIDFHLKSCDTFLEAFERALKELRGAYGIAVLTTHDIDALYIARLGSPLVLGITNDAYIVASDPTALIAHTTQVVFLNDYEYGRLPQNGPFTLKHLETNQVATSEVQTLEYDNIQAALGDYACFMEKEIYEAPQTLRAATLGRLQRERGFIKLGGLEDVREQLRAIERIVIVACGTSYYAGLVGEYLIEEIAGIPVEVQYASEFKYRKEPMSRSTALLAISQSGETADTIAAIQKVENYGVLTLGIVNVVGSTIARMTDAGVYCHAGPERAVASTKAFIAQVTVLTQLALYLSNDKNTLYKSLIDELDQLPQKAKQVLKLAPKIKKLAGKYASYDDFLYIGRGVEFPSALEGALKLKEVSYVHAEGYGAGEMKHGPLAMIDPQFPVLALASNSSLLEKTYGNIEEIRARKGKVIAIGTVGNTHLSAIADDVVYIPETLEQTAPLLESIVLQLFAYYIAVQRGLDVDKPRNLAKSVTVE